ncbi:MAG: coproporphyrinogen III oxidase, partial [Eubacteriales bacterium]|nr:coproporphyrinogen III oxidase [Eubacteriales bacterium]
MHRAGMARLESLGYKRYEISNYARPSCQCRHNINYWDVGEYIGLGLNSSSALRSKSGELIRFKNCESIDNYISEINCGRLPRENVESIGRENEMFEWIMLGLRKIEGVELGRFKARFGADVCEVYREAVNKLENMGWLTVDQRFMRLTDRGLDMQNSALMEFMQ